MPHPSKKFCQKILLKIPGSTPDTNPGTPEPWNQIVIWIATNTETTGPWATPQCRTHPKISSKAIHNFLSTDNLAYKQTDTPFSRGKRYYNSNVHIHQSVH